MGARVIRPILLAVTIAACSSSEPTSRAFENREQGYLVTEPAAGWTRSSIGASTVFTGTSNEAKHQIVIRAVQRPSSLGEHVAATEENIIAATRRVLASSPGATIEKVWRPANSSAPTTEFSLTFTPPVAHGVKYQRRHAVVVARTKIFHVFYTAPAGENVDASVFDAMVSSIREQG